MIFWPRETATLLKSNLRFFHREKSTFEKFDAGLKLRIVFYTHKTIKNRKKNFRVIYTLTGNVFFLTVFTIFLKLVRARRLVNLEGRILLYGPQNLKGLESVLR